MGIKTDDMIKMKEAMEKAASAIRDDVLAKHPVFIRHHADTDGYAGAIAIERAITSAMHKVHKRESDLFYYLRRMPSRTPYYDFSDALKDIGTFLQDSARFERKTPLFIIIDMGSSGESALALGMLKAYGAKVIVIDHHPSTGNDVEVLVNPHTIKAGYGITASMLASEVAELISGEDYSLLSLLGGITDRSAGPEMDELVKKAEQQGYSLESLRKIGRSFDYLVLHVGYMEARLLISDMLFGNRERQERVMDLIACEIDKKRREYRELIEKHKAVIDKGRLVVGTIYTPGIMKGMYPGTGMITGMLLEMLEENKPAVALGITDDSITFRISRSLELEFNSIMNDIKVIGIDGGGHPKAGTMRFPMLAKDEILKAVMEKIS